MSLHIWGISTRKQKCHMIFGSPNGHAQIASCFHGGAVIFQSPFGSPPPFSWYLALEAEGHCSAAIVNRLGVMSGMEVVLILYLT